MGDLNKLFFLKGGKKIVLDSDENIISMKNIIKDIRGRINDEQN